jgi:hypothetical protein
MIESLSEPTIGVKQIEIRPYSANDNVDVQEYWLERYGSQTADIGKNPLVWYNGIVIPESYIESFYLNSDNFFPTLQIYFSDETSEMINTAFAQDNTTISIFIDSRTKDSGNAMVLKPIRMDFKLVDFAYIEEDNLYYIQGVPDIDGLYLQSIKSFRDKTSFQTLKDLSQDLKLGFNSNVSDTNDAMNWMNMNLENYQFIKDVTKKSYKNDNSFFTSFVDYQYNLNFIDVEKQLQESLDVKGVLTLGDEGLNEASSQKIEDLYIVSANYIDSKYNNLYESYEVLNKSTKISLNNGYRTKIYYYDKTGNWEQKAGTFLKFNLETNTDGRGIIMKSYPEDDSDNGFFKQNSKSTYLPITDIDNTHKNYNFSHVLNEKNLEELDKVSIKITMREPNFNFYKFQKIRVFVMNVNVGQDVPINKRLTGGWLIKSINYYFDNNTQLKQELVMIKRELSAGDFDF